MIHAGIDIVFIPGFSAKIRDEAMLKRLFHEQELAYAKGSEETLAGIFAAKEAYYKAYKFAPDWLAVEIVHQPDGSPVILSVVHKTTAVSISHDGEYAVAVVIREE